MTSEFSGIESDMTNWKTENASSTVMPNDTFSPASGGNQYTCSVLDSTPVRPLQQLLQLLSHIKTAVPFVLGENKSCDLFPKSRRTKKSVKVI